MSVEHYSYYYTPRCGETIELPVNINSLNRLLPTSSEHLVWYHTILANQANLAGTLENIAHGTTLTLQFTAY